MSLVQIILTNNILDFILAYDSVSKNQFFKYTYKIKLYQQDTDENILGLKIFCVISQGVKCIHTKALTWHST